MEIIVTDRSLSIAPKTRSGCWSGSSVSIRRVVCLPVAPGLPAIGKHLVANLGSKVQLWSGPGTGATFVLRLPAHPDSPQHPSRVPSTPERGRVAGVEG